MTNEAGTVSLIVLAGPIFWSMKRWPKVLHSYRDWIADVPDELTMDRRAPGAQPARALQQCVKPRNAGIYGAYATLNVGCRLLSVFSRVA